MIFAEAILTSYFIIVEAKGPAIMMIPLFVTTIIFVVYLHQRHFKAAGYLSSEDCMQANICSYLSREEAREARELFGDKYVQPSLVAATSDAFLKTT